MLVWAVFRPTVISSKQGGKKKYNKCKYQRGWGDWNLKKSVFLQAYLKHLQADMKKDNVISDSKKVNKIVFGCHFTKCHFLSTDGNDYSPN